MAKIKGNPIMKGASGMLGKTVVYRQFRGQVLMCNRPRKRDVITPHQEKMKTRFLEAVQFAKRQIANPETKALYQPGPESKFTSAYAAALAEYLQAPVVECIDLSKYDGKDGDEITISVNRMYRVIAVLISIYGADGKLIETGQPLKQGLTGNSFMYKATAGNLQLKGTRISIVLKDSSGDRTIKNLII